MRLSRQVIDRQGFSFIETKDAPGAISRHKANKSIPIAKSAKDVDSFCDIGTRGLDADDPTTQQKPQKP